MQVGVYDELHQGLAVQDPDDDGAVARSDVGLVPEHHSDRRSAAELRRDLAHEPAVETFGLASRLCSESA